MSQTMPDLRLAALVTVLLICVSAPVLAASDASSTTRHWPAPIQQMADKGLTIVKAFDAPGGLTGYAAKAGHRPVALYLTPDGQHVIVGTLLDGQGKNLTKPQLEAAIVQPRQQNAWPKLADSHWIADGKKDAPRTIYVFTDPNCPYCHKFYEEARPWVNAGKVQLRQVMVGMLRPSSPGKAAALLSAKDPSAAYHDHEKHYQSGGIKPMDKVPSTLRDKVIANNTLMSELGIRGTPGIVYKDADGKIQIHQGVPHGKTLDTIMGPK